ncbi:MAG: hypothetical protein RSA65_10810, partial [Clostridia bacterium]
LYVNVDLGVSVNYSDYFGVVDATAELDNITKSLALAVGGRFDAEVKKRLARLVLKDAEDNVISAVIDDIEKRAADLAYAQPKE